MNENPFVEIEIAAQNYTGTQSAPVPLAKPHDPVREKFYAMRQIGRDNISFKGDNARAFYFQARFMADFEDDYDGFCEFSNYFPYYQQMSYEQLRTYFTWRTRVRKGDVTAASLSYAFLYVYELLHLIGCENAEDALARLMRFWRDYGAFDKSLDDYLPAWVKDFFIYYKLVVQFDDFAKANGLEKFYPEMFCFESGKEDSFGLFAAISKYDPRASIFYTEQNAKMIDECFYFILSALRERFSAKGKSFEGLIFKKAAESTRRPFERALFYQTREMPVIQDFLLLESGQKLVGYIMKEAEAELRKLTKFKYRLNVSPDAVDGKVRTVLGNLGVLFPQFIREKTAEFYAAFTRKNVEVDFLNLHQIRSEALQTQEKLIVEDEEADAPAATFSSFGGAGRSPLRDELLAHADPWQNFFSALTDIEREALRISIDGGDLSELLNRVMLMLEVLADGINEKAMEFVSDNILEAEETGRGTALVIYEEYIAKIEEVIANG